MRKLFLIFFIALFIIGIIYLGVSFYLAKTILRNDHSCGAHEGSLPNTWSTKLDYQDYSILAKSELRKNFKSSEYHLDNWQEVYFPSRDEDIKISGWLFYYYLNKPIVIIVYINISIR